MKTIKKRTMEHWFFYRMKETEIKLGSETCLRYGRIKYRNLAHKAYHYTKVYNAFMG